MIPRRIPSPTSVFWGLVVAAVITFLIAGVLVVVAAQADSPGAPTAAHTTTTAPDATTTAEPPSPTPYATTEPTASSPTPQPMPTAPTSTTAPAPSGTAASVLSALTVRAETGGTYDRGMFMTSWLDADGDGCDTRREVLIAESRVPVTYSSGCTVTLGSWLSYVDGVVWTAPADVDIDHTVPLKEAFDSGAASWAASRRSAFANDLGYDGALNAITDNVNSSKSDRDPAEWMPLSADARCEYAVRYVAVKARWTLSIDAAEHSALHAVLSGACGSRPLHVSFA